MFKKKIMITFKVDETMYNDLREYCKENAVNQSELIRMLLDKFLEEKLKD